jgi:hypothetical protein
MFQEIAALLGPRVTSGIATSALPGAPVRVEPDRRPHLFRHRVLGMLRGSDR